MSFISIFPEHVQLKSLYSHLLGGQIIYPTSVVLVPRVQLQTERVLQLVHVVARVGIVVAIAILAHISPGAIPGAAGCPVETETHR